MAALPAAKSGSATVNRTGYTPTSSSSASSIQWSSDVYLGNHTGVAEFTSTINSMIGTSVNNMNLLDISSAVVNPVNEGEVKNNVAISVGTVYPGKGSSLPSCYRKGDCSGSSTASGSHHNFNITSLFARGGNTSYLAPTSGKWVICFKSKTSGRFHNKSEKSFTVSLTGRIYATRVNTGGSISAQYVGNGQVRVSWSAGSAGTNNSVSGYYVYLSSSKGGAVWNGKAATTTALSYTFSGVTITSVWAAVYAVGYYSPVSDGGTGNGNTVWTSAAISTPGAHPSVSAGGIIYKSQMDSLRTYKNNSPTAATQGGTITSSVGNTYAGTTQGGIIYASWYNNA